MESLRFGKIDLEAYFREMGASLRCPFCACEDWVIEVKPADDDADIKECVVTLLQGRRYSRKALSNRFVLVMTCERCGFLRLQDLPAIFAWKDRQEEL